jgi:cephalosporin-C deacetylase-like acetyl esterase
MGEFGALQKSEEIRTAISGARAWKVTYSSADLNGAATVVTGLVIAPATPSADRPLLTWCHGTTGLGDAACPSAQPDPARELITYFDAASVRQIDYGVPGLQAMINAGWIVCATDYQGLGTPGQHQYLASATQARDAVAIARAARALDIGAGTTLGCMGWSQGGGTAAAVAELEPDLFGDLRLIGTVPMSPGVASVAFSVPGVVDAVFDPKGPIDPHIVMAFAGYAAADSSLDLGDLLTPLGVSIVDEAWNEQPVHHLGDTLNRLARLKGPVLRQDPQNFTQWLAAMARGSACRVKPTVPIFLCIDGFDGGTVIPVTWQQAYLNATLVLGAEVTVREYPNDDHFSLPASCVADGFAWLQGLASAAKPG